MQYQSMQYGKIYKYIIRWYGYVYVYGYGYGYYGYGYGYNMI